MYFGPSSALAGFRQILNPSEFMDDQIPLQTQSVTVSLLKQIQRHPGIRQNEQRE
jgi:hypothetical protein